MHPFTCPRCGMVSHSLSDAVQDYCGRCRAWTGYAPGGPVSPGERALTPDVLLASGLFTYEGTADEGRTTVWAYDPLRGPWVSSWRPDLSMGAFTADWTGNQLRLRVSAETMARAVMERFPLGNVGDSWSWEELARQLVPADQAAFGPLEWSHAASDPLADIREARRLIEAAGAGALDLAGRTVELHGTADQAQLDALGNEIRQGLFHPGTPAWITDAIAVWENSKDQARRERTLAELAQDLADAEWQIRPSESGTDSDTAARWSAEDAGDVIL